MKRICCFLLIVSVFLSCVPDDNPVQPLVAESFPCKILKCGKVIENSGSSNETIYYTTEFIYLNNRIIKRVNYKNNQYSSTDSIAYNSAGLVSRIYDDIHSELFELYTTTEILSYLPYTTQPNRREIQKVNRETGVLQRSFESISYDGLGRILKTVETRELPPDLINYHYITTTDYTYLNNNLSKVVEKVEYTEWPTRVTTFLYSNFDNRKNPFRTLRIPLTEMRHLRYSLNNRRNIDTTVDYGGFSNYEHSTFSISHYDYNEFGYPLIAEYQCQ